MIYVVCMWTILFLTPDSFYKRFVIFKLFLIRDLFQESMKLYTHNKYTTVCVKDNALSGQQRVSNFGHLVSRIAVRESFLKSAYWDLESMSCTHDIISVS